MNNPPAETADYLSGLQRVLANAKKKKNDKVLFDAIVNAPFKNKAQATLLNLGIVVLLLVNPKEKTLDRVTLSDTELAKATMDISIKPFHDIKIPLGYNSNLLILALKTGEPQLTNDWAHLFAPELNPQQARLNQAKAGIGCSMIHPFTARGGGALIFSFFSPPEFIKKEHRDFMTAYTTYVEKALAP